MATNQANAQEPTMEEILASIRRIISEDAEEPAKPAEKPAPAAAAAPKAAPPPPPPMVEEEEAEDVLDLTDIVVDEEEPELAELDEDEEDVVMVEKPAERPLPKPQPAALRPVPPRPDSMLLSEEAAEHASTAFQALSRNILVSDAEPKTLEHLVQEMLKPVLKDWLNQNLPSIVERLVQAEIERVARKGRL